MRDGVTDARAPSSNQSREALHRFTVGFAGDPSPAGADLRCLVVVESRGPEVGFRQAAPGP